MTAPLAIVRDTWTALLEPRRAFAIGVLAVPLLFAQAAWNLDPVSGVAAGGILVLGALLVAPAAWRVLAPGPHGATRYGWVCLVSTLLFGLAIPRLLGVEDRFLTQAVTLPLVFGLFAVAGYGLGRDIDLQRVLAQARIRNEALARDKERAELLALRAQLDPHFLFNTLSAIAEWCHSDPLEAERAILRLAELLRAVQAGVRAPAWPLSRELALCRDVLELYRARDPGRYGYDIEIAGPDIHVPPMLLLPLVENAIKHGPAAGHAGRVLLRVRDNGRGVIVEIRNPGPYGGPRDGGEGLALTRRRLALAWGETIFEIGELQGQTWTTVYLPGPVEGGD